VQLLGSFIAARSNYTLARLEFAMASPRLPTPPVIARLSDASEHALRDEWPTIETQLDEALTFAKRLKRQKSRSLKEDAAFQWLERSVRELDQYARAIRWVLTVTESEDV